MRQRAPFTPFALSCIAFALFFPAAQLGAAIDARMLRQPDVSATDITFVYAGDIWIVPKSGGTAQRLSTPAGEESFPRFSPDGREIAFSGNYDGNQDVYVVPSQGGLATRVTHHPSADRMIDWYPDGESLLFATHMTSGRDRFSQLYKTSSGGGLPAKLPVAYGEFGAVSSDGQTLAFMPASRDFRTWKRYRGGLVTKIWLFDLADHSARVVPGGDANNGQPMWHGSSLYFLSDRGKARRNNIWVLAGDGDPAGDEVRQITHFTDYDVRFPAIGPEEIIFESAGRLYLLDLASEAVREVEVDVVTDLSTLKPRTVNVSDLITNYDISPSGKRAVLEARGDVFTVPAEHGFTRNLTHTSGVAERYPTWSPDGEHIAFLSDRSGEYELTLKPAEGGEEKTLTALGPGFRYRPWWSPDSKKIAFVDQAMHIRYYDLETSEVKDVDRGKALFQGALQQFTVSWSGDSRWLAYDLTLDNLKNALFLFDTTTGERHQVTSGYYSATSPVFDPAGKYLFFLWDRALTPSYSDFQGSWIYANSTYLAAVPLRADVPSPVAPRNDTEDGDSDEDDAEDDKGGDDRSEDDKGGDGKGGDDKKADSVDPVDIDIDGFEGRIQLLPPAPGNFGRVAAVDGKVLYLRRPRTGASAQPFGPQSASLDYFDLEEREEKTVVGEANDFRVAAGGEKILVRHRRRLAIVNVGPDQKLDKELATSELETVLDPAAEWRQIFTDAWRFERDYFYDPNLHGVDWPEMRLRYGSLLEHAVTRWDVNFILGELIGELNASHAYRGGGDQEQVTQRQAGLLGADYSLEGGAYRIANIVDVSIWETEVRSPLRAPGIDVDEGDYLLAVNGIPIDTSKDPWAAFDGLAEQTVMLTINDGPSLDGAREVLVKTLSDESRLRNLAWIENNRRRIEEATDGRVGYIYLPSTALDGQSELVRQFTGELGREALIVDERFNSGGQIPDRFIELLNRPVLHYWAVRDGTDWQWPQYSNPGPKVMLINGWSGSGGDLLPFYFKSAELGPLIGETTWGGLIGISGSPGLIDGGGVTVPTFAAYSREGEWIIEGQGVDPDIEVIADPSALAKGVDPQLERAIEEVMRLLKATPNVRPSRPAYEDRSGV